MKNKVNNWHPRLLHKIMNFLIDDTRKSYNRRVFILRNQYIALNIIISVMDKLGFHH